MHISEMIKEFENLRTELSVQDYDGRADFDKEVDDRIEQTIATVNPEELRDFAREVHSGLGDLGVGMGFSMYRLFEDRFRNELHAKNYSSLTEAIEKNDIEITKAFIKALLKSLINI